MNTKVRTAWDAVYARVPEVVTSSRVCHCRRCAEDGPHDPMCGVHADEQCCDCGMEPRQVE